MEIRINLENDLRQQHEPTEDGSAARERLQIVWNTTPDDMIATLQADATIIRTLGADALGRVGDERAVLPLIEAIDGAETGVTGHIIEALTAIAHRHPATQKTSLPVLVPFLTADGRWLRVATAEVLAGLARDYPSVAHEIMPGLVESLLLVEAQAPYDLTMNAIIGIGKNAIAPLKSLLEHHDEHIRSQATYILEQF